MSEWNKLAYTVLRAHLDQNSVTYAGLNDLINQARGNTHSPILETERSLESKILRGTFSFAFYIECLDVLGMTLPVEWEDSRSLPFEIWAALILRRLVDSSGLSHVETAKQLSHCGIPETAVSLRRKLERGTYRFAYLLQISRQFLLK